MPTDKGGTKGCATACWINEWKLVHMYETGWVRSVHQMSNAFIEIVIIITFFVSLFGAHRQRWDFPGMMRSVRLVPTDKGGTKTFSVQGGQVWRGWACQSVLKTLLD